MQKTYKRYRNLFVGLAIALFSVLPAVTIIPPTVHADPTPTCGGGATLVRPTNGDAPYCSCPQGKVLVTGDTNTCASSCPSGDTSGTDSSSGQKYCNPPDNSDSSGPVQSAQCGNQAVNQYVSQTAGIVKPTNNCDDPALSSGGSVTCNSDSCNLIDKYITPLVYTMSALVGVAVTVSVIIGGIQYGSSAGDPQKATAAKNRIRNALIALVAYLFLFAFLQFLVPGGLFRT